MDKKELKIFITTSKDRQIVDICKKIAEQNNVKNGGFLRFIEMIGCADYIVCCTEKNRIVGYAALNENFAYKDDIYITQIAVQKEYQNQGVGTKIFDYILHHSKQYKYITSNVRKENNPSLMLHKKFGFNLMDIDKDKFIMILKTKKLLNKYLKTTKKVETKELSL